MKNIAHKLPGIGKALRNYRNALKDKEILQLEKGQLEADVRGIRAIADNPRTFLAHQFLKGSGIEVGAAHHPLALPPGAKVKYVDVFSTEDLRKAFPLEYQTAEIVHVDVVDDGEKLTKFKQGSQDFIIANHFLEHCLDPIGTVLTMYAKLRKDGVLFMAVPDMRYTFDHKRPLTTYEHLLEEHQDTTNKKFRTEHTREYMELAVPLDEHFSNAEILNHDLDTQVQHILDSDYRVHYHVWTQREITELFVRLAKDFTIDLEIQAIIKNQHEVIYVLRREGTGGLK